MDGERRSRSSGLELPRSEDDQKLHSSAEYDVEALELRCQFVDMGFCSAITSVYSPP